MGSRIIFQEGMDVYQTLPTSGARAPGFAIGDTDYGGRPIGKNSLSSKIGPTFTQVAKRACTGTLPGGSGKVGSS